MTIAVAVLKAGRVEDAEAIVRHVLSRKHPAVLTSVAKLKAARAVGAA